MRTAQDIVNAEIYVCLSSLVSTLANRPDDGPRLRTAAGNELADLCWQAIELACPIDDWEETAIQHGWKHGGDFDGFWYQGTEFDSWKAAASDDAAATYDTAEEACFNDRLEPYQREVFEHWAVSAWLADQLEARGEKVDKDFAGMRVWARTTTGQAIYADAVFEAIAAELAK